jgi:hypothetical protein
MSDVPEPPESTLPVETAIAADQAAAQATEGHGHHGPFHTHCENCGTKLEGPFCHKCGQHDFEFHRSFWHVFLEGLESFLHFDSKLFHTVATLLFQPGRLTAAFNAGKRASQMPPLRLYIFVSLVFFFLFFLNNHAPDRLVGNALGPNVNVVTPDEEAIKRAWTEAGESFAHKAEGKRTVDLVREAAEKTRLAAEAGRAKAREPDHPAAPAAETSAESDDHPAPPSGTDAKKPGRTHNAPFVQWLEAQGRRLSDPEQQRGMIEKFMHALPKILLFCLPFFALYTRVLFRKAGLVYLQHLVLALHVHTMILIWSMLKNGWVFLAGLASPAAAAWIATVFNIWLFLYPFLMFRRLFAGSWVKTVFKTGLLCSVYGCTLVFAALIGGFIIFAML